MQYLKILGKQLLLCIISLVLACVFVLYLPNKTIIEKRILELKCLIKDKITDEDIYALSFSNIYIPEFIGVDKEGLYISDNVYINKKSQYHELHINDVLWQGKNNKDMVIINNGNVMKELTCNQLNNINIVIFNEKLVTILNFKKNESYQTMILK